LQSTAHSSDENNKNEPISYTTENDYGPNQKPTQNHQQQQTNTDVQISHHNRMVIIIETVVMEHNQPVIYLRLDKHV
jgi:hypothetical protein